MVFPTDRLRSSGDKKNICVVASGVEEEGHGVWAVKILVLLTISAREDNEGEEYAFLRHTEVPCPLETEDKTLRWIRLGLNANDEVDHSLR